MHNAHIIPLVILSTLFIIGVVAKIMYDGGMHEWPRAFGIMALGMFLLGGIVDFFALKIYNHHHAHESPPGIIATNAPR